jgi:hypothetical protein
MSGKHRAELEPHQGRVAVAGALTAVAGALSVVGATPIAHAGPAPDSVETDYVSALSYHGYNGPRADEIKLGYLLCALNQVGGSTPSGGQVYLNTAQATGLCDSVSTEGRPSKADIQTSLQWALQQSWYR